MLYHIRIVGGADGGYSTVMNIEMTQAQLKALHERVRVYAEQGKLRRMYVETEKELAYRTTPAEALKEVDEFFSVIPASPPRRPGRALPSAGINNRGF